MRPVQASNGVSPTLTLSTTSSTATTGAPKRPPIGSDVRSPDLPPGRVATPPGPTGAGGATVLVGRTQPQNVVTPRFDLAAAVTDPAFVSRDPATLKVPPKLVSALKAAKSVLVVSHIAPDGDAAGSALSLQRALTTLGKQVDVCIDDDIPGDLRVLDSDHALKRAKDLEGKHWDLAVIVDVSGPERIGNANADLLAHAKTVAVVDHHVADPKAGDFRLRAGTTFLRWMEPDWPAAALMAGAIIGKLTPELRVANGDLNRVLTPALVGFGTDTGWATYQGIDSDYFRYFKSMLVDGAKTTLSAVEGILNVFKLPQRVWDLAMGTVKPASAGLPAPLAHKLESIEAQHHGVLTFSGNDATGKPGLGLATASTEYVSALLAVGKLDDPQLITQDVLAPFKYGRLKKMQKDGYALSAFVRSTTDGAVICEFRSNDDAALRIAQTLGGGGHDRAAGATLKGASLDSIRDRIIAWAREQKLVV